MSSQEVGLELDLFCPKCRRVTKQGLVEYHMQLLGFCKHGEHDVYWLPNVFPEAHQSDGESLK